MNIWRWYLTTGAAILLAAGLSTSAVAQGTYDPWRNPDTSAPRSTSSDRKYNQYDNDVQSLVRDLEELIRIGRRDRAADPRFLDDLEGRLDSYKGSDRDTQAGAGSSSGGTPRSGSLIFSDKFKSGSQANSPDWQVVQSGWYIDNSEGLRSNVRAGRAATQSSGRDDSNLIDDLFSSKKKRKKKRKKREEARKRAQQPLDAGVAELRLYEPIPNNFKLNLTFRDFGGAGVLSAFLYQKGTRDIGYRLEMRDGGGSTVISLLRVGSSKTTLIDKRSVPSYRAGGQIPAHKIKWFRYNHRRIGVSVDGKELFTLTDRSFRDNWDGIALTNTNGHFAVRSISLSEIR